MAAERAWGLGAEPLGEAGLRLRAFFGLPLPDSHRSRLDVYLRDCAAREPRFRWTPAANLHVTVRFLGHLDAAVAEGIADQLEGLAVRAFELQLGGVGAFKRGRLARVVWVGFRSGEEPLRALAAQVESECVAAGLEPETRRFSAHITLARARARDGAALGELPPPPELALWRAEELILYQSRLGRGGSVYEPMRRIRFR